MNIGSSVLIVDLNLLLFINTVVFVVRRGNDLFSSWPLKKFIYLLSQYKILTL